MPSVNFLIFHRYPFIHLHPSYTDCLPPIHNAWLHASSKPSLENQTLHMQIRAPNCLARAINAAQCDRSRYTATLAQRTHGPKRGGSEARIESLGAVSNSSSMNRAMYAQQDAEECYGGIVHTLPNVPGYAWDSVDVVASAALKRRRLKEMGLDDSGMVDLADELKAGLGVT
ncbi:hypothetical protein BDQ12DRAFT_686620 [Crucibulum laeve]|uniref:Uncharacterized protein n=1 Tax=Crucibulum laeve TaxID=68775 RepID=A0A5C3LXC6_9AGAR|nr:hypothetical protein BDQ12DRAFT_686620 [Crucibulum laeve]